LWQHYAIAATLRRCITISIHAVALQHIKKKEKELLVKYVV
jgi:stress-induced morphogen